MKYKALLVDADDTLLDFKKTELEALLPILKEFNIPITEDNINLYSKINLSYWKRYEKKELTQDEVILNRWTDFFAHFNIVCDPLKINTKYFDLLKEGAYLIDGAIDFLIKCNEYLDVYVITNGNPIVQHNRLEKSEINKYIKKAFISMEIGYSKPDVKYFEYVLNYCNLKKEECIILGDSLSSDIKGAINADIDHVLFDPSNKYNEYTGNKIKRLDDFLRYLK